MPVMPSCLQRDLNSCSSRRISFPSSSCCTSPPFPRCDNWPAPENLRPPKTFELANLLTHRSFKCYNVPILGVARLLKPPGNSLFNSVKIFAESEATTMGEHLKKKQFLAGIRQREAAPNMRKSRKQFALELGVSQKTLWGWEIDRWQPSVPHIVAKFEH